VGSYLVEQFGFEIVMTYSGFMCTGLAVVYGLVLGKYFFRVNKTYLDYDDDKLGLGIT